MPINIILRDKKPAGVPKTPVSAVKTGIAYSNLVWFMDEEKVIISMDATQNGKTVSTGDITVPKKEHIKQHLFGAMKIAQMEGKKRLRSLKNE